MGKKTWIITGTSQGFGKELVKQLLEKGDQVVATTRNPKALDDLNADPNQILIASLNIKDRNACFALVQESIEKFGKIDVLINNIGYGLVGSIEEVSEEEWREQFEVNVFGTLHMTQAVLPHFREQGSGYIQVLSSIAGLRSTPGIGYYNGSKFALEGMFEALSQELSSFNIGVTIIEPGPFRTNFAGDSIHLTQNPLEDYVPVVLPFRDYLKKANGNQAGDPVKAAKIMIDLADNEHKPKRLVLGKMAYQAYKSKLQEEMDRLEKWKDLSDSADFS